MLQGMAATSALETKSSAHAKYGRAAALHLEDGILFNV